MNNINTQEYWDKVYSAEVENNYEWRTYPTIFGKILDFIDPHETVAEFGCGTGILGKQITEKCKYYVGYDISEYATTVARSRLVRAYQEDILDPDFKFFETDVAVCSEFLEHFKDEELKVVMEQVSKCNQLIAAVPNDVLGNEDCHEHHQKWDILSFKEFLKGYYNNVVVMSGTDLIKTDRETIRLPYLLAYCSEKK